MATNNRRPDPVERLSVKIKTLLNAHLKDILRHEGLPVSGVKQELINRLQSHIQVLANEGNIARIQRIQAIAERGQVPTTSSSPPASYSPAYSSSGVSNTHSQFGVPRAPTSSSFGSYSNMPPKPGMPSGPIRFKPSPFFTIDQALLPTKELKVRESTRDTIDIDLALSQSVANLLQNDPGMRVMVYCAGDNGLGPFSTADVAFPHQVELKCNQDDVKANLRGLKNKPGSTRPADITHLLRKKPGYPNKISVTYALTTKKYFVVINLVRRHSVEELIQRLKGMKAISKEQVLREMRSRADDADIVATSTVMSLKCPLSTLRIEIPTRSMHCTHNQCFDGTSFLQLQEQAPTWTCPICNRPTPFDTLAMDLYVDDILKSTNRNVEQVTIEPGGTWSRNGPPETPDNSRPSASSPDDDDDDLVEISDSRVAFLKQEYTPASSLNRTPPYSSREQSVVSAARPTPKRPASMVIDLTESDDEDIPVRPIKRPSLAPSAGSSFRDSVSFQLPRPNPTSNGNGSTPYHPPTTNHFFNTAL